MITTGIIKGKNYNKINQNLSYIVDIAIFKNAGIENKYNNTLFDCPCSVNPGTYEPYYIGDKVYIGFVNNKWDQPIILGKIYEHLPSKEDKANSYQYINSLKVEGATVLSNDTKIDNMTWQDMQDKFIKLDLLQEKINSILTDDNIKILLEIIDDWKNNHQGE